MCFYTIEDENTVVDQDQNSWHWECWHSHSGGVGAIVNIGKMTTNVVEMDDFFCNVIYAWDRLAFFFIQLYASKSCEL